MHPVPHPCCDTQKIVTPANVHHCASNAKRGILLAPKGEGKFLTQIQTSESTTWPSLFHTPRFHSGKWWPKTAALTCSSHATVPSPPQARRRKLFTLRKRCSTSRGSSWLRSDTYTAVQDTVMVKGGVKVGVGLGVKHPQRACTPASWY